MKAKAKKQKRIQETIFAIPFISWNTKASMKLPQRIEPGAEFNAFVGKLGDLLVKALGKPLGFAANWGRLYSLWPVHLETGCCSVELGAASGPRYDLERFGILEAFGSLRQCDLIIVLGTVNRKMAPRLRLVYDQMPEPKYVIGMGACAITGGLYFDSYNVLPGVDNVLPVDVYVPGCPPRPETLIQAVMLLQEKIKRSPLNRAS